jgi:ribose 5-phosphate isomerase B
MAEVIPIGSDHAGYQLKEQLIEELWARGYEPMDLGSHSPESTGYAEYAHEVASEVEKIDRENG